MKTKGLGGCFLTISPTPLSRRSQVETYYEQRSRAKRIRGPSTLSSRRGAIDRRCNPGTRAPGPREKGRKKSWKGEVRGE